MRMAVLLVAVTLVIVNAQCVAICAATACEHPVPQPQDSAKLPPCHRHHVPKSSTAVKPCTDSVIVIDSGASRSPLQHHNEIVAAAAPAFARYQPPAELIVLRAQAASPPILASPASTSILRI